jgi:16S rRNA (cytosine1402-N4)-methyltransferase
MEHKPVLLHKTIELLNLKPGMTVVDGTLGGGGHAAAILERITPGGRLIGIDRDEFALGQAKERLKEYSNVEYVHGNFKDIKSILGMLDIKGIDGAVLDIGVSSFQLDQCNRGFSYKQDSRLDMRMNMEDKTCAADIVASYAQRDLERIFRDYGEERWAARIAEFIVRERSQRPITTTAHLVEVIKKAVPSGARKDGPHPARRCFQALRIEVNGELDAIKTALADFVDVLNEGGRIAVITFHSLEDRIVKQEFKRLENPCECPSSFPICVCGKVSVGKVVTGKPIVPTEEETEENSRAHSAKLRAFERRFGKS